MGFVPTFYFDLGFRPTFGVYYFYDDVFGNPNHSFRLRANGTIDGYSFAIADRWQTDPYGSRLQLTADVSLRPDRVFYGIGPETLDSDKHRYGFFTVGGSVGFDWYIVPGGPRHHHRGPAQQRVHGTPLLRRSAGFRAVAAA